jgi:CDP-diacylglycerol--glycerol-3-phosphate 3-phosphatidyltransferase
MNQTSTAAVTSQKPRLLMVLPNKLVYGIVDGLSRLADVFVRLNVSPNSLSVIALLAALAAGLLFALRHPVWAAIMIIVSGFLDIVDGKVAVKANKRSLYGAIFDSTLDRYSEFFIYLGLAVYFRNRWPMWIVFFTFLGSTMVSYTRARAEGLGIECKIGFMQRAERMILLDLAAIFGSIFRVFDPAMIGALIAIALISNITAFERTYHVRKIEKRMRQEKET